jgi:hypothetical protein
MLDKLVKPAVAAASLLGMALGALLTGGFVAQAARGEGPFWTMLLTGLALGTQGGYTLLYAWLWRPHQALSAPMTRLLVAGQATALTVGSATFLHGVAYNLHPRNGDFEFLPMTAGALMAAQAAATLGYVSVRRWREQGQLPA